MAVLDWLQQLLGGGGDDQSGPAVQQNSQGTFQPYAPPQAPSALDMLGQLTGASDMQQAYGAAQRGEYLPALGQGAFGAAQAASLAVPALRGGLSAARAGAPMAREMLDTLPALMRDEFGGIKAYHGSPYDFNAFDASKIGTGEGNQTYGYGLYFADKPEVAAGYRQSEVAMDQIDKLLRDNQGKQLSNQDIAASLQASPALQHLSGDEQTINAIRGLLPSYNPGGAVPQAALRHYRALDDAVNKGRMYEVNINAEPDQFLNWDKPLSEQGGSVQQAMRSSLNLDIPDKVAQLPNGRWAPMAGDKVVGRQEGWPDQSAAQEAGRILLQSNTQTGGQLYESSRLVPGAYRDPQAASAALNQMGIPGIRYLDQGSRGAGQGTSNYVVFDPSIIEILRKYGLAGLTAGGGLLGAADQQ